MKRITLTISGMTCKGCVSAVRQVLARIEGIAEVDVTDGSAVVAYDEGKASENAFREAVTKAGFDVVGVVDAIA